MKNKKRLTFILSCLLLISCLAVCKTMAASPNSAYTVFYAEEDTEDNINDKAALQENFKLYEQFGMTYNPVKDELRYNGKLVRWFEDYYEVGDGEQCGIDFFNENGVIDVYAVRDFSNLIQYADGSFDPSGKVIRLKKFSDKEFAARNINAIKNPPNGITCSEGESMTAHEIQDIAAEYAKFGVSYNASTDKWYYNGEKIRFLLDILSSNGESLNSGNFHGGIRQWWNNDGTVDVYTVRGFNKLNGDKNGTLTAIKKYSQKEFDVHTQSNE